MHCSGDCCFISESHNDESKTKLLIHINIPGWQLNAKISVALACGVTLGEEKTRG